METHRYKSKEDYIAKWGLDAYQEFLDKRYQYYLANKEKINTQKKEHHKKETIEKFPKVVSLPGEVWLPVVGAEKDYKVSNFGRVKAVNYNHTGCECLMKQSNSKGYKRVSIVINGEHKSVKVHRLVAEAGLFYNPDNLPQVNHKSEDKTDNSVWNLEWCDSHYNIHYGTAITRRAATKRKNAKGTAINVFKDGVFYKYFSNVISASRELGIDRGAIFKRLYGKVKADKKGLTFEKAGENE